MRHAPMTATVIIVGAGITGIGAAYYLSRRNISYLVLEADSDLGGVWNTHKWHGARCDSDIVKYSFSFAPFPSRTCLQDREQIQQYLRSVAERFAILDRIRFNTRVVRAVFDPDAARWTVHTTAGTFTSRFLFNGNGYFAEPHVPTLQDSARFKGELIHASALDSRRTFHDKDVVLVGSGATAISCAPALAAVSRSLVLLQRSPSYVYETRNRAGLLTRICLDLHRSGMTFPVALLRLALQCKDDLIFVAFRRFPRFVRWFFVQHWRRAVDPETLRRHFRPRYNPWEQRIAVAVGLKQKIGNGQIVIKTGEIDRFTDSAIVMTSGEAIQCDVCVLATGFDLDLLKFDLYVGGEKVAPGGRNLYKGLMLGGVPNYFHPFGAWHTAWTQTSETVTRFAIEILAYMETHGLRTVSVARREVAFTPPLTSGYVKRCAARMPRFHGTCGLPSIDNLVSYRFDPRRFNFA